MTWQIMKRMDKWFRVKTYNEFFQHEDLENHAKQSKPFLKINHAIYS